MVIITGGSRTDGAWSQSHWVGYQNLVEKYPDFEITFVDMVDYPDHVAVLSAASAENDLVLTDTTLYEAMMEVPPNYPDTWYAFWCPFDAEMEGDFPFDNVVGYEQRDEDGGFLAGVAAGLMTKTNKVGYVAGQAYPEIIRYGYGFKEGIEYINPDAELLVLYTGSWVDIEKAYESSKAMIDLGADVLAHYSDAGGHGVAKAVNESEDVWFIGEVLVDEQTALAPDRIITGFVVNHVRFMEHAVETLIDGTIHRELYTFGVKPGSLPIEQENLPVIFPLTNVPADVRAKVEEVEEAIYNGEIVPGFRFAEEDLRPLY
ncbi:BMP family protein [Chloroflexota bacterium]